MSRQIPPPPTGFTEIPPPPEGFTVIQAEASAPPEQQESLWQRAKKTLESYLPSPRTALRVGGGLAGGAIGAIGGTVAGTPIGGVAGAAAGGAAGASIGESIYQIGQHVMGDPEAPASGGDAAMRQAGALTQGAMQEAPGAYLATKAPAMLRSSATKNIEQAIAPSGMAAKEAVQKTAPTAVGRMPVATSTHSLRTKLDDLSFKANDAVNKAYQGVQQKYGQTRFDSAPMVRALEAEKQKHFIQGSAVVGQEPKIKALDTVIDWLKQHPRFDIGEFRAVKQNWDEAINYNKFSDAAAKDPAFAEALEQGANHIRDTIHTIFPSLKKVDADAHLWATLTRAAKASDIRGVGQDPARMLLQRYGLASTIGGGVEYARGGNPVVGAVAGAALASIPQSILWDTLGAATKAEIMRFIQSQAGQGMIKGGSALASGMLEEGIERHRR